MVWKHLDLPDPTPLQYEIALYLQGGPKRQVIEAFRGCGKSWITAAFVLWCLLRDPQRKFLVVSASKQRADAFSIFTLRLIREMPILKHLIPRTEQRESMVEFDVGPASAHQAASVRSAGIESQITGGRAHHIIADDVEVPKNSATQALREKLLKSVSEFEAIIIPEGKPRITFLGTPQTEESIYNLMNAKGYDVRIWPARYPGEAKIAAYRGHLAPTIQKLLSANMGLAGEPVDPRRFDQLELLEREASYGRSGFALQFMLDTSLSDAEKYPLKTGDLIVTNINSAVAPIGIQYGSGPQQITRDIPNVGFSGDKWCRPLFADTTLAPYEGIVMAVDPSGRGSDETTYAVVAQLHGNLWVLDIGGFAGGYEDETLEALCRITKRFSVKAVIVESNFGDGMFTRLLQPHMRRIHGVCAIDEVSHSVQKEKRIIDVLEPLMNQHRLVMDEEIIRRDIRLNVHVENRLHYSLFYQMTRLCRARGALKHDDLIDALAMACTYWVDAMSRDEDTAIKSHQAAALAAELENHQRNQSGLFNSGPVKARWGYSGTFTGF